MLYGGVDLSHGEVPTTGWEVVLRFRAPGRSEVHGQLPDGAVRASSAAREAALSRLRGAGFAYSQVWAPAQGVVLVRLALPEATLRLRAEDMGLELELQAYAGGGFLAFKEERARHYVNHLRPGFFSPAERLRVNLFVLGSGADWGAAIDVDGLRHADLLKDAYPAHDRAVRRALVRHAVFERWWDPAFRPDFGHIKDYLGSRMGLYFAFLGFYTRMLIGISLVSVPVYFILDPAFPRIPLAFFRLCYGAGLVFWCSYFLKYWKRRNAILNVQWGTAEFYKESHTEIRPQYVGTPRPGFYSQGGFVPLDDLADALDDASVSSSISGDDETVFAMVRRHIRDDPDFQLDDPSTGLTLRDLPSYPYCPKKTVRHRLSFSVAMTLLYTFAMILLNFLIIFYTSEIVDRFSPLSWAPSVPGILTGILIFICDNGWKEVSKALTKWENHRTSQEFENSGIVKRFAFQFVSNYFSLFYIAFVKPYTSSDPCAPNPGDGKPDCMVELGTQLGALLITRATLEQLLELGIPTLIIAVKRIWMWIRGRRAGESNSFRQTLLHRGGLDNCDDLDDLQESRLDEYENSIEDYGELVIQYGYIALFGIAYPLGALVCLVNNLIEVRSDAFKILVLMKRVPADEAADIGMWTDMLKLVRSFAIWTNAGLITFTTDRSTSNITDVSLKTVVFFFVLNRLLLWLKDAIEYAVTDVPGRTLRRQARQEYLVYRWFGEGERPQYKHNMTAQLADENAKQKEEQANQLNKQLNEDLRHALESSQVKS